MDNSQRLYKNLFTANTPARDLQSALLASCMIQGNTIKGTLLDRVLKAGADPLMLLSDNIPSPRSEINREVDRLVDTLRFPLHHKDYNKPGLEEHTLLMLLSKAF